MTEGPPSDTASIGQTQPSVRRNGSGRPSPSRRASKPRAVRAKTELELLGEINKKLDRVVAVLAAQGRDRDTQVAILAGAGCDSAFVGRLLKMTPGAVRNLPSWRRANADSSETDTEGT